MSEERILSDIVWTPERGMAEPEVRGIAWNNFLLSDGMYDGKWRTDAGIRITPDTALQSTVVLACCRILAETIGSLPIHIYRRTPNGGREIASEIPLYKVLTFAPNSWQTKYEFFEQLVMTICLWGNSYTRIKSGRYGSVSELDNLHPSNMDVERLENGRLRYSYTNPETGRIERYTQDQIMHCRWTPEPDGIKGMVPVEVGREAIALARACEIHASKFWANNARPGIVLQTEGTISAEAAQQLRENWNRIHRGVESAYQTAILTNGLKATEIGFTNEASQFNASRAFQSEEIARIYRLPLHLVQGQSGGNLEVAGQEFVTYTLVPWLRRIESAISRSLIYNDDVFFAEFDVRGLLRGDSNSRASYYSTMISLGIYSINDCRRLENLPPLGPDGDHHFVAMNVQTLADAVKPKPDPMAAMMGGGGAPPAVPKGVPSLPGVKTGEAPPESVKGEASEKKPTTPALADGDLVTWGDGNVGEVKHVMDSGTLDLKSGEKIEVEEGQPVALVEDESGEEHGVPVSQLKKVTREQAVEGRSADCGRQDGGKFGPKNNCAAEDGVATQEPPKKGKALSGSLPDSIPVGSDILKARVPFKSSGSTKNSDFVTPPSDDAAKAALDKNQQLKYGAHREKEEGYPMSLRIDIKAFENKGTYVVTAHEKVDGLTVGTPIGYDNIIRLSGPVQFKSKEDNATLIATGNSKKSPIATVTGGFSKSKEIPADIDSWTAVGYDPKKAAYFYDKKTGEEVVGGQDSVSVGNTVFVRKPTYGNAKDPSKKPRVATHDYRNASFWGLESRADDCGRQEGGKFGPNNDCAKGDGSGSSSQPSSGGKPAPAEPVTTLDLSKLLQKIAENPEGFTLDPLSAEQPADGIMVSQFSNDSKRSVKIKASEILEDSGADAFRAWFSRNSDLLAGDPSRFIGGWKTGDDFYIDVATRFPPDKAEEALEAGRDAGQLAVFNLGTFKETWVKYSDEDTRKPDGWDSGFARARKDSTVKQVYGDSSTDLQEEDWADELTKHGNKTVRYYNGESEEATSNEQYREIRRPDEAHDHRGLQGVSGLSGEGRGVAGEDARQEVVRGQPGSGSGVVQGSAGTSEEVRGLSGELLSVEAESREDDGCGRGNEGEFGPGNTCAAEDGSSASPEKEGGSKSSQSNFADRIAKGEKASKVLQEAGFRRMNFSGIDRALAKADDATRERIVRDLEGLGEAIKIEPRLANVAIRVGTMESILASRTELAAEAVDRGHGKSYFVLGLADAKTKSISIFTDEPPDFIATGGVAAGGNRAAVAIHEMAHIDHLEGAMRKFPHPGESELPGVSEEDYATEMANAEAKKLLRGNKELRSKIKSVSKYAATSPFEAVAEYTAAVKLGVMKNDPDLDNFCEAIGAKPPKRRA